MASHNKILLVGVLKDTPDVKATTSGHSLAKFTLTIPRIDSLPNQKFDHIQIVAWRDNADACTQFQEGDQLYVEGRILANSFEDPTTGQRKWTTEVEARQLVRLSDVFSDAPPSSFSPNTPPSIAPTQPSAQSNTSNDIETLAIPDVSESDFFNHAPTNDKDSAPMVSEDSENELDEDVPF